MEVGSAVWSDHVLLDIRPLAVSVHPAVEDVHHRHRQPGRPRATEILVQRMPAGLGRSAGAGHRNAEDGVGAEAALVGCPVQGDHPGVDLGLEAGVHPGQAGSDRLLDRGNGAQDPFPAVAVRIAIAQLHRLATARGCPGRYTGAGPDPAGQIHLHLHGGVSARIEDLAPMDSSDGAVHFVPPVPSGTFTLKSFTPRRAAGSVNQHRFRGHARNSAVKPGGTDARAHRHVLATTGRVRARPADQGRWHPTTRRV